jgi:hypothetical protein
MFDLTTQVTSSSQRKRHRQGAGRSSPVHKILVKRNPEVDLRTRKASIGQFPPLHSLSDAATPKNNQNLGSCPYLSDVLHVVWDRGHKICRRVVADGAPFCGWGQPPGKHTTTAEPEERIQNRRARIGKQETRGVEPCPAPSAGGSPSAPNPNSAMVYPDMMKIQPSFSPAVPSKAPFYEVKVWIGQGVSPEGRGQ